MTGPINITLRYAEDSATFTSRTQWLNLSELVATAVLSAIFTRFPDALQNIFEERSPNGTHVEIRTSGSMPTAWTVKAASGAPEATSP